jgi:glyoxylase-like metal-dependent hydrolase (beta-lactamase superfamily II)
VFQAAEGTTGVVNGNITLVVGREAALVVDTGQFPSIARRVIADIRRITPLPVRHVVNTHWHGDHLLANSVFKEAWPQARFIAHSHTIAQGARFYTDYAKSMAKRLPGIVDGMRKERAATRSAEEREFLDRTLDCVDRAGPDIAATRYLAPDLPVDREREIDLGGVKAVVRHLGSGNTPGDLIVWLPEARVAIVGDMLVHPAPYAIGSDLAPWTRTLGRLRALEPRVIVPGHGPVMHDDGYVRDVEALLESTRAQLASMHARGLSRQEAEKQLDTARFRERYIDTPMRRQAFEQFFVKAAVQQVWGQK